ncbi:MULTISPECIES: DUF4198 domain-containing protein [unclassified Pseudomonas]|uniref:DUF4198 domain-containing protein n=1 Tax=unclassified Pseudomonas TaxID=196821 RepID=UPI00257E3FAF|nr:MULTISPECIES: DUF4198 domain-containing protein [unclassified Pseudomonas]
MNTKHTLVAATLALSVFSGSLFAHALWPEERRGQIEVVFGEGAEEDAYDPARISGAWAYDTSGKPVPITVEKQSDHARLKPAATPAVLAVALDNGYWAQGQDKKWVNKGATEVSGALASGRYYKYSLAVMEKGAKLPSLDALKFTIIPQRDPLAVEPGETLEVQVLLDGKPASGIKLYDDVINDPDHISVTTDAQGRAQITVRPHGRNVIGANTEVKQDDPNGRVRGMFSTLVFVSPSDHHH